MFTSGLLKVMGCILVMQSNSEVCPAAGANFVVINLVAPERSTVTDGQTDRNRLTVTILFLFMSFVPKCNKI
jgi:hypothetical protein